MRKTIVATVFLLCVMFFACGESQTPVETTSALSETESDVINEIVLSSATAKNGDEISVPLGVNGNVDFCAVDLKIYYDSDKLEFVKFTDTDEDVVANCDGEGTVFVNFLRIKNVMQKIELCKLNFKVKTDEVCSTILRIEPIEIVRLDDAEEIEHCNCTVKNGTVSLNGGGGNEQ